MKKIIVLLSFFVATTSFAWTISWDPVTTYTDSSLIEGSKIIYYNIKRDGVALAPRTTATSLVFTDTGRGLTRSFTASVELSTGEVSAESPTYSWTVPLGSPRTPANLRVAP
jgi:hypothetical protein